MYNISSFLVTLYESKRPLRAGVMICFQVVATLPNPHHCHNDAVILWETLSMLKKSLIKSCFQE